MFSYHASTTDYLFTHNIAPYPCVISMVRLNPTNLKTHYL